MFLKHFRKTSTPGLKVTHPGVSELLLLQAKLLNFEESVEIKFTNKSSHIEKINGEISALQAKILTLSANTVQNLDHL